MLLSGPNFLVLIWTFAVNFPQISGGPVNVEIVSLLPYDFGMGTALVRTGSAFALAVEEANKRYAPYLNMSLRLMYNATDRNCEEVAGQAIRTLSEYYYRKTDPESVYAIIVSRENFFQFKEWDWLMFANGASADDFVDKEKSPTGMATGGTLRGYTEFTLRLCIFHRWFHITVLLQTKAFSSFYSEIAGFLLRVAAEYSGRYHFDVNLNMFDLVDESMIAGLNHAKHRSRGDHYTFVEV
ncbi:hypothetical protein BV898_11532 [Hypsibius exemplaris]|uniref:Receptor ligand binding region domain-containing protein n=1 Tax=Hypsibius exemplaris TaxID=2072580 RepID=A0A1W0WGH9_HYPEX|nr:hypothetical protein BV898_11532 [Hypsibius exemplaris]